MSTVLCLYLFFLCAVPVCAGTIVYQPTGRDFPNPERGFYIQRQNQVSLNVLQDARRDQHITILRNYYRLDDWVNAPLPQSFLDQLDEDLNTVRRGGAKIIPRFSYNFGRDGTDAPLDRILSHIEQAGPVLHRHHDILAFMEAGFIGAWGEWHSSDFNLDNNDSRRAVLLKLLDALPENRMAAVRVNTYKREIYGTDDPLGQGEAFDGSNPARTGAHNDCLGASERDWGTYPSSGGEIQWQKDYLNRDNRYVPQGGETCNVSEYSVCAPMLADLERMRWDVLNIGYHQEVLQSWRDGGCFEEVKRSLGYRLQLIRATLRDSARPGGAFAGTISITNTGWGKLYNPRGLELVFREKVSKEQFSLPLKEDPRRWLKGDTAALQVHAIIPEADEGTYELFLFLPDPVPALRTRPEYSIRLANQDVWEASTGYNSLLHEVAISQHASPISKSNPHVSNPLTVSAHQKGLAGPVHFSLHVRSPGNYTMKVYNPSGKTVWNHSLPNASPGHYRLNWNTAPYPAGLYMLWINGHHKKMIFLH